MKLKSILALTATIFLPLISFANTEDGKSKISYSMPGVEVGFKWNTVSQNASVSDKQEISFQLGAGAVFDLSGSFGIKSGLFYSERAFYSEFGSSVVGKGKITYFDVPIFLMLKFEDYAGVYVGPTLSVKLGDEYSNGSLTNAKSMITPITFGAQFKYVPSMGANIFFETVPGDLASGLSNARAVGVNLIFTLD